MSEGRKSPEGRLAAWILDRRVDRLARKPWGRRARATYGADDAHDFLWPRLLETLELTEEDRLLDVGCGGGAFLRHVRATVGCRVAGVDHSRTMVRLAAPYAALGDAHALPFESGFFTAVSSLVALMFLDDPVEALREMRRVLDPERGRLALWTASPESRGTPASPEPVASRAHLYADEELLELAHAAGFREARLAARDDWAQLLAAQP